MIQRSLSCINREILSAHGHAHLSKSIHSLKIMLTNQASDRGRAVVPAASASSDCAAVTRRYSVI